MKYSEDKYKVFFDKKNRKVIAISTYAGKPVKGYAKADPRDEYDIEAGKKLAIARCNQKIAEKRAKRAGSKVSKAMEELIEAQKYLTRMQHYLVDANVAADEAEKNVESILKNI